MPLREPVKLALGKAKAKKHETTNSTEAQPGPSNQINMVRKPDIQYINANWKVKVNQFSESVHPNKRIKLMQDVATTPAKIKQAQEEINAMDTDDTLLQDFLKDMDDQMVCNFIGHTNQILENRTAILDSGASIHVTPWESDLIGMKKVNPITVYMANNTLVRIQEAGTILLSLMKEMKSSDVKVIKLNQVYHH